nr:hypothetical protein [Escherichia coli]
MKRWHVFLGCFPCHQGFDGWAVLSLLQFILVQVLVRTNDGGRKAVREYIVINDELRDNLSGMPHAEWGHHIDAIIRQEKRRIRDQILEMYIRNEVDRREAILLSRRGVTVMKEKVSGDMQHRQSTSGAYLCRSP